MKLHTTSDEVPRVARAPQEGHDALLAVLAVDPLEAGRFEVDLVERRLRPVEAVQVPDEALEPAVVRPLVEEVPVEARVVVPLVRLPELAAHEEKLLAGMPVHEPVESAQVGELLPVVARHLAEERALAVDHLVVGQRQDEVLVPGVEQPEGELVVVVLPVDRVVLM